MDLMLIRRWRPVLHPSDSEQTPSWSRRESTEELVYLEYDNAIAAIPRTMFNKVMAAVPNAQSTTPVTHSRRGPDVSPSPSRDSVLASGDFRGRMEMLFIVLEIDGNGSSDVEDLCDTFNCCSPATANTEDKNVPRGCEAIQFNVAARSKKALGWVSWSIALEERHSRRGT